MFYKQGFTDREYKIEHVKPQRILEAFWKPKVLKLLGKHSKKENIIGC